MNEIPYALSNVPENLNFLSPLGHKFIIKRCPNVSYFLFRVNIPGINLPMVEQPTPFVPIIIEGDHGEFEDLVVTFQVHEDLQNWLEIHNWMRSIGKFENFHQFDKLADQPEWTGLGLTSEIILTILNSDREPNFSFVFHGAMPTSLSGIWFDSKLPDVRYLTAQVIFKYTNFDFEKVL